jgi:arginase
VQVSIVATPYGVELDIAGRGSGPARLLEAGLAAELEGLGHHVTGSQTVSLTHSEETAYGGWDRVATANGHLARLVAGARGRGSFVIGLLSDCNALLGMLGGLQRADDPTWPLRAGLLWIDAHADYNTPETSPSGMLGGMPVAVAAGRALPRLRSGSGMALPLQAPDIVLAGVRDVDRLEGEAIAAGGLHLISPGELTGPREVLDATLDRLAAREEVIYVHVDLDILDPAVAPAAGLPSPGGLTGEQLGRVLRAALAHPKVGALGIASYRAADDPDGATLKVVTQAILEGARGLNDRL